MFLNISFLVYSFKVSTIFCHLHRVETPRLSVANRGRMMRTELSDRSLYFKSTGYGSRRVRRRPVQKLTTYRTGGSKSEQHTISFRTIIKLNNTVLGHNFTMLTYILNNHCQISTYNNVPFSALFYGFFHFITRNFSSKRRLI